MQSNRDSALKVAEFLLQIKAVKLNVANPFTWASGWQAPIYCDNRITLSYPSIRTFIRQQFVTDLTKAFGKPDVIAGVATGGIAHGALVAQELGTPFVYVRATSKGHGLQNLIEGHLASGQSVVVIEDLISTGQSSLKAIEALRQCGAEIKGLAAVFTYNFDQSKEAFKSENVNVITLTDYTTLVDQAIKSGYIDKKDLDTLEEWRAMPEDWKQKAYEN